MVVCDFNVKDEKKVLNPQFKLKLFVAIFKGHQKNVCKLSLDDVICYKVLNP